MCGRFAEFSSLEKLQKHFPIDKALAELMTNYNVAPTQEILAIICQEGFNILEKLNWGLVPHWAKDISIGNRMINARMETVSSKPSFRDAFKKRRCLIPADGFYEWTGSKGQKQPFFITLPDEKPIAFAGLWEIWHHKENHDKTYRSCTIITREASECLKDIHNRMPAVLDPETYGVWLDQGNQDTKQLQEILADKTIEEFKFRSVSKQVNSVRVNDPSNIASVSKQEA
jgi:putative SOS response-associated peptidase YedK